MDETLKVVTVDLQAILLCPLLKASALYYRTKLAYHNYTIFDLATKEVICYFWYEAEGDLSAHSFASCLTHYLESLGDDVKEVIIYSDGCTYQNRNCTLANALLHVAKKKNITVVQKYLERGHTQMECDSIHSTIERKLRKNQSMHPIRMFTVSEMHKVNSHIR